MSPRLAIAIETGALSLPETGVIRVYEPSVASDLGDLPQDRTEIIQPFWPDRDHWTRQGYTCLAEDPGTPVAAAIVCLPRTKALARALVAKATSLSMGWVAVDGAKTDGIDSLLKDLRASAPAQGSLSKAHGKIAWFHASEITLDPPASETWIDGFVTTPGVFSADAIDSASKLLAGALPNDLGPLVADLGAGWGYLSARIVEGNKPLQHLHLVEVDARALAAARRNVPDPRAVFHWADARTWSPPDPVDSVVMNPPFHTGRKADPALGQAFIAQAARILTPGGHLWMVANRHLPYEAALAAHFKIVTELPGASGFKLFCAERPTRARR